MRTQLFVNSNVPGLDIIRDSVKNDVMSIFLTESDGDYSCHFDSDITRI
jgi:hypothetical protein